MAESPLPHPNPLPPHWRTCCGAQGVELRLKVDDEAGEVAGEERGGQRGSSRRQGLGNWFGTRGDGSRARHGRRRARSSVGDGARDGLDRLRRKHANGRRRGSRQGGVINSSVCLNLSRNLERLSCSLVSCSVQRHETHAQRWRARRCHRRGQASRHCLF